MRIWLQKFLILLVGGAALSVTSANAQSTSGFDTESGVKSVIENIVLNGLPGPAGEMISVFQAMPTTYKAGLQIWLDVKMQTAVLDGNIDDFEKYLNFYVCISSRDCTEVGAIEPASGSFFTPPASAAQTTTFKIVQVFSPSSVISDGEKGTLTVFWTGNPQFPVEMIYRPAPNGCTQYANCSIVREEFDVEEDPLRIPGAVWCTGVSSPIYFGYEVLLRDSNGFETPPVAAGFACNPS